jgi:hypothetical protein
LKLRNKGLSLRVRRIGRHHVQTIKQESSESAVAGDDGSAIGPEIERAYVDKGYQGANSNVAPPSKPREDRRHLARC